MVTRRDKNQFPRWAWTCKDHSIYWLGYAKRNGKFQSACHSRRYPKWKSSGKLINSLTHTIVKSVSGILFYHSCFYFKAKLKSTSVMDFPRFTYRGIMLDSSRHFLPKNLILDNLDLMEMNKFNVFHWHLTDSQSFPYQSNVFPDLR